MAVAGAGRGIQVRRVAQIKHMKERFRGGLNATSGNFPAGSNVRIIHTPQRGRR